jgi:hypothetical protein
MAKGLCYIVNNEEEAERRASRRNIVEHARLLAASETNTA